MYNIIEEWHNLLGIIILAVLLIVLIIILINFLRKKLFGKGSKIASLVGLIVFHTQLLVGIALYLLSPLGAANFSGESMEIKGQRDILIKQKRDVQLF